MNLLFEFVQHLPEKELAALAPDADSGHAYRYWQLMLRHKSNQSITRQKFLQELEVSSSHLDKLTSLLLASCYTKMFGNNTIALLDYLSSKVQYNKHYYHELKRQLKKTAGLKDRSTKSKFYLANITFIQLNMPIVNIQESVIKKLADAYVKCEKTKEAELLVETKLLYVKVAKLFAAAQVHSNSHWISRRIKELSLPANASEELTFSHYWLKVYFYHAAEQFKLCGDVLVQAIQNMKRFKTTTAHVNLYRLQLKQAEMLYYDSRFEDSFNAYTKLIGGKMASSAPEHSYHVTKFLQICLITEHLGEAKLLIDNYLLPPERNDRNLLPPRDIISLAKYYLFKADFNMAHQFIQLGFLKNPKARYFQYEVELRNLQLACLFMEKQMDTVVRMCRKNLRFLAAHGYTPQESNFPHYYMLTKKMALPGRKPFSLTQEENTCLERYRKGSYAVYGMLLNRMLQQRLNTDKVSKPEAKVTVSQ